MGHGWFVDRDYKNRWFGFRTTDGEDGSPISERTGPYETRRQVATYVGRVLRKAAAEIEKWGKP